MTVETGSWLTAVRVARLPLVLRAIRNHRPPGIPAEHAERVIWQSCGGPLDDVPGLIAVLTQAELISSGSTLRLTKIGRRVATQDHQHGGTILARTLIRTGFFADQARRLVELSQVDDESGEMTCFRRVALENAPQLVGQLRLFDGVVWEEKLRVPVSLSSELTEIWSLLPMRSPKNATRKAIGDRGELYSYRFEQLRAKDSSTIRWVARDDESLGYDVEDNSVSPQRRIEVKASSWSEPRFFLSANEWEVAHCHGEHYEIHFWGTIDLNRPPPDEYSRLRAAGYPIIFLNVSQQIADGTLIASPTQYLVEHAS